MIGRFVRYLGIFPCQWCGAPKTLWEWISGWMFGRPCPVCLDDHS